MTVERATTPMSELLTESEDAADAMVGWRRTIHRRPELGLDNPATRDLIADELTRLGLPIRRGEGSTWLTADIVGNADGPTFLLRADTDALPMTERSGEPFASEVAGRAHTCGHDAHVAMLLGAARLLVDRKDSLDGVVRLAFQPGEEGSGGAKIMIEDGMLTEGLSRAVEAAFAIHVTPNAPVGFVAGRVGAQLAAEDHFTVVVRGKGTHASTPHFGIDPMPVAAELVGALGSMVGRRVDAFNPAILTVAHITGGTTFNVIPDQVTIEGTVRTVSEETRASVAERFVRVCEGVTAAHECGVDIDWHHGYPVTVNDGAMVSLVRGCVDDVAGPDRFVELPSPVMGAEDFAYVAREVPAAMAFLGVCPDGIDDFFSAPSCHSDLMRLNESAMPLGAALHASVALRYLG